MTSLFNPLVFRTGLSAKNRVLLAPMTNQQSHEDGTLSDQELAWLASRADGGFGAVITCAAHVAKDGQGWPGELGVFDDAHVPGLARLADALRARGAASIVQIFHGGLRADVTVSGAPAWSASDDEGARPATEEDLSRVVGQFAAAAARAEAAGVDGVEIHGAHGYLLTQFLSATQNRRRDRWGGA
ncbi:MAG: NADH:flavin oxidoreductase, partial [Labilithrix sp.]|nr:NADH:flavin oxidoreductase [Labilithrix sp.]